MSMRKKLWREERQIVVTLLREAGVGDWTERKSGGGHLLIEFYHAGRRCNVALSASGDWRSRLNLRRDLRRILGRTA